MREYNMRIYDAFVGGTHGKLSKDECLELVRLYGKAPLNSQAVPEIHCFDDVVGLLNTLDKPYDKDDLADALRLVFEGELVSPERLNRELCSPARLSEEEFCDFLKILPFEENAVSVDAIADILMSGPQEIEISD